MIFLFLFLYLNEFNQHASSYMHRHGDGWVMGVQASGLRLLHGDLMVKIEYSYSYVSAYNG